MWQGLRDAWEAVHYSLLHSRSVRKSWHLLAAKQATSLLRFCVFIPADWAYATAGAISPTFHATALNCAVESVPVFLLVTSNSSLLKC